jgi:peptidoglycan hydrolase-like protein with peptidoglycan-binding domain
MRIGVVSVIALGMLVAACGSDETQRSATGGLTGIGVGAAVGGPVGAVVGGVVGAAGGAAMPEGADTIAENAVHQERAAGQSTLREAGLAPAQGSSEAQAQTPAAEQLREAQRELEQQGLYHGKVDGILGPKTKAALSDYQKREGLQQTASLDQATLQRLGLAASPAAASGTSTPPAALSPSELRGKLQQQGYGNIGDIERNSDNSWNVHAQRGDQQMLLRVDARTGRVLSQHELAAAGQPAAPSGTTSAPAKAPSAPDAGGNNPSGANNDGSANGNAGGDTSH